MNRRSTNRQRAESEGRGAERWAAWWLRFHGWRIIGQRVRVVAGEVDIIAKRGGIIAFVEVKRRKNAADLDHAIDSYRLRRVVAAANMLATHYARNGEDIRVDVILLAPRRLPRHLVNVTI